MRSVKQKAPELYETYCELYAQFKYDLDDAKGLFQECRDNAKDNCMMDYTMNLNLLYLPR